MNCAHKILITISVPAASGGSLLTAAGLATTATLVAGNGDVGAILGQNETEIARQINADNMINLTVRGT